MKKLLIVLVFSLLYGCVSSKKNGISNLELKTWYQKDYIFDKTPGISLDKWYAENKKKPKKNIIVATLDTQIDTNHEDLKGQLWENKKEIPNNNIDDDHNGYINDIEGWNFLGTKSGNYTVWSNFEYVRIVREYNLLKQKKENEINSLEKHEYDVFKLSEKKLNTEIKYYNNWLESLEYSVKIFPKVKDTLKYFFPKENYSLKQLDSLYKIYKINDKTFRQRRIDNDQDLGALVGFMKVRFEFNEETIEKLKDKREQLDSIVNKNLNINYNERLFIGENSDSLEKGYGNNKINSKIIGIRNFNNHNTEVSGIIAANRENNIGINGFSNNIKIMPLSTSCSGDEHDKDIAMAIYYAVDNGAKIINMSFTKEFSLHKEWVFDALKYAEKHNVLVVHISGNDNFDIDINPIYPNDNDYTDKKEVCNNFINVGSITQQLDSTFVSTFSNYGKENVDLFAPGSDIYTTSADNEYTTDSGTSLAAPMVSGTAALIWLYYPNFTVQEVKQIILESGTSYDIEVLVPGGEGKKTKFSELSKSGKVLNVYNAMKMAKEMSKKKK